jgi:hypothetical protein
VRSLSNNTRSLEELKYNGNEHVVANIDTETFRTKRTKMRRCLSWRRRWTFSTSDVKQTNAD